MLKKRPFTYMPPMGDPEILFQDTDIIVLNKPSGLLSVPGRLVEHKDSLARRVQLMYPSATVVHRLDLETSGVMVMALNKPVHRHISRQFEHRKTQKTYIADILGVPEQSEGTIDQPIAIDWPNRPRKVIDPVKGKPAMTHWTVIGTHKHGARVRLKPITGRSHQLRVHMQWLGHPILGDSLYADDQGFKASDRLHLHAEKLGFQHPETGEMVQFSTPCPFKVDGLKK